MSKRVCSNCIYDGCCDGLPFCGGRHWHPADIACDNCGARVRLDDVEWETEDGKHIFCSEECLKKWEENNRDDSEE